LGTVEEVSGNMPVACFLDSKEQTEAAAEGDRGSAANGVRRKNESLQARHFWNLKNWVGKIIVVKLVLLK